MAKARTTTTRNTAKSMASEIPVSRSEAPASSQAAEAASGRALSPFEEMDQLLGRFTPRGWLRPLQWERPSLRDVLSAFEAQFPRIDIIDRPDEIMLRAELPGIDRKNLDVSLTENTVTLRGTCGGESEEERGEYFRSETWRGGFSRTVALPGEVDSAKAKAVYKDGILELRMPKLERSRRRTIKVT